MKEVNQMMAQGARGASLVIPYLACFPSNGAKVAVLETEQVSLAPAARVKVLTGDDAGCDGWADIDEVVGPVGNQRLLSHAP